LWDAKPADPKSNYYRLYAIKMQVGSNRAPLEGDKVISARQDIDQNGSPEVAMSDECRRRKDLEGDDQQERR
jgi:hypothetical protein